MALKMRIVFLSCLLLLASFLSSAVHAEMLQVSNEDVSFHYVLVMSKERNICNPLTKLYDDVLKDVLQGKSEYSFREWENSNQFSGIGLEELRGGLISKKYGLLYRLNLFGNNSTFYLLLIDHWEFGKPSTFMRLYKSSISFDDVEKNIELLRTNSEAFYNGDVADERGVAKFIRQIPEKERVGFSYIFVDWPNFEEIYSKYVIHHNIFEMPAMYMQSNTSRIFYFSGNYYKINNYYFGGKPSHDTRSAIILQKFTEIGLQDVCYIVLSPTALSDLAGPKK